MESTEVKTFTNSGITAPASVPQVITVESFHQSDVSPASSGTIRYDTMYVRMMETIEVSQTSDVSGASKFILSASLYLAEAIASLMKYDAAEETIIITRM